jgi:YjbE family integral membrane protein
MNYDWVTICQMQFTWPLFVAMLNIIFINLILSGDNAVLIAMAVRNLKTANRIKGMILGTGAAVVLRVVLTYFVALLLKISFLKLTGGLLIFWIAVKLFTEAGDSADVREAGTLRQAVQIILVADLTMSLDNVLAIAGAAGGNLFLLIFGLVLSIPMVIFTAQLLSSLMDRYPLIIVAGAAILGRVAGEMVMTDPAIQAWINPSSALVYFIEGCCMITVVLLGKYLTFRAKAETTQTVPEPTGPALGKELIQP